MLAAVAAHVAAAAIGTPGDWQWAATQGGFALGMGVCAIGWRMERKRADAERASRDALAESIMGRAIPALEASAQAQREVLAVVRDWQWEQDRSHPDGRRPQGDRNGRR